MQWDIQWEWAIRFGDLAVVFATLAGPILAVQAQGWIDARREERRRRMALFHTLMRTRGSPLAADHVNALNAVPLEYPKTSKDCERVHTAWREYLDHFSGDTSTEQWGIRRVDLLRAMLSEMGTMLGYKFDNVELKNDVYVPMAHGAIEEELTSIRQNLAALLRGDRVVPLEIRHMPGLDPVQAALRDRVLTKFEMRLDRDALKDRPPGD